MLRSNASDALVVTLGPVGAAVLSAPTTPGTPVLAAPSTGSTLTLQWAQPSAFVTAVTQCLLAIAGAPSGPWRTVAAQAIGAAALASSANSTARVGDLSAFTQYWVKAWCANSVGSGPETGAAAFTTAAPSAPSAPSALAWRGVAHALDFAPPLDDGGAAIVQYEVYAATGAAVGDLCAGTASAAAARAGWSGTLAEAAQGPFAAFVDGAAAVAAAAYVGVGPFAPWVDSAATGSNASVVLRAELVSFLCMYRYILRESCSQCDSLFHL